MSRDAFEKDLDEQELLKETENLRNAAGAGYVKKEDKYNDLKSSSITFICFGVIGIIIIILHTFDIIQIPWLQNFFSVIVLLILFIAFLLLGISSWIKAAKMKTEITEETSLTDTIKQWLEEHVSIEDINQLEDSSQSSEVNYFAKTEAIKQMLFTNFPNADTSYIDMIVDEFYTKYFE